MSSEWQKIQVADLEREGILLVQDGNHGEYRPRQNEFGIGDSAFIRAADMVEGRVLFDMAGRINDVAVERIRKGKGKGGDVIFSHKGTVGKVALTPLDSPPFVCSPQTTFWRTLDTERLDRQYLYCFMRSQEFTKQWSARKGETDMADYVSLTAQRNLHVIVPPIEEQRAIGKTLSALDDKIELNRQMNHTLEAMAQAIFKSWFVDFDPVTAKVDGRQPYGMNVETAALFPSRFVESEEGAIPEGWSVMKVEDCINRQSVGTKYDQKTVELRGSVPVLDQGKSGIIGYHSNAPGVVASIDEPIVVFANHTCYMRLITFPFSAIQNVLPFAGRNLNTTWVYYATLGIQEFVEYKGHWPDFVIKKIIVPPEELADVFSGLAKSFLAKIRANDIETKLLESVRNSLLPKLLSGEIHVKEAEKQAEAAA